METIQVPYFLFVEAAGKLAIVSQPCPVPPPSPGLPVDSVSGGETLPIAFHEVSIFWGSMEWSLISKEPVQWHLAGRGVGCGGMLFAWWGNSSCHPTAA